MPIDTSAFFKTVALAEAQTAAESWEAAARLWAQVVAINPVDGQFWAKLGEAHDKIGNNAEAITALERAFELRDAFPAETAARIAACHAKAGEPDLALEWLERAAQLGLRRLPDLLTNPDFASLRDDTHFRDIVGVPDIAGLSRDDGWRADLDYLRREIDRRAVDQYRLVSVERFRAEFETLRESIPECTDAQLLVGMGKLVRLLGDGHAGVYAGPERHDLQRHLPLRFYLFAEGMYVIAADERYRSLLGCRIVRYGERDVADVLHAVDSLICRDNENEVWVKHVAMGVIRDLVLLHALDLIPDRERVSLTVQDLGGNERAVVAEGDPAQPADAPPRNVPNPDDWPTFAETLGTPLPHYLKHTALDYWFEYLTESRTVYFQFNRVRDASRETLAEFTRRLFAFIDDQPVDKLVIDLRWNGGGNTFLEIPLLHALIGCRKINQRGRLFVIIGRRTFSAAQNGATLIDRHTEAIFVGEPTGSGPTFVGETVPFQLPFSKLWANVSDLLWQSGWPMDYRRWIAPTLYTPPTFAMYRENRDPALEAILTYREQVPGW